MRCVSVILDSGEERLYDLFSPLPTSILAGVVVDIDVAGKTVAVVNTATATVTVIMTNGDWFKAPVGHLFIPGAYPASLFPFPDVVIWEEVGEA